MQSSTHISGAMNALYSHKATASSSQAIWLLMDPALHSPLDIKEDDFRQILIPVPNLAKELSPRLIVFDSERDERVVQQTIEVAVQEMSGHFDDAVYGRPRSMCAWLRPQPESVSVEESARLLADMARIRPPVDERGPVALRFWDPRITVDLIALLPSTAWAGFLARSGIAQWWYMDESSSLASSTNELSAACVESPSFPWCPSPMQWDRLNRVSWRNRISHLSQGWRCVVPPTRAAIDAFVTRATEAGLTNESDVVCFVHACLSIHPEFDRHPEVQEALRVCNEKGEAGLFQAQSEVWQAALDVSVSKQVDSPT